MDAADSSAAVVEVVVRGTATRFAQDVQVGRHRLAGDEPASAGGADAGPSPYDFLCIALGTCKSMTMGLYARRKGWPVGHITVRVTHSKIHAADCAHCETKEGTLDRIECTIELDGDLTPDQRSRLVEIASRCPVHKTLTSEIDIQTRLV
jgi:putative redox protein